MKENLALIARGAASLLGKILILTAPVSIFNWVFIIWMGMSLKIALVEQAKLGESAAWPALIGIVAFFAVLMPFVYFNMARNYGIKSVIFNIVTHNKQGIFQYIIEKILDYTSRKGIAREKLAEWLGKGNEFLSKLEGMGFFVRVIYKYLLGKIPFNEAFVRVCNQSSQADFNPETLGQKVAEIISDDILKDAFKPELTMYFANFVLNLLAGAALVYWLNQ